LPTTTSAVSGGGLPKTGASVGLLFLTGGILLLLGTVLLAVTRRRALGGR
jgi:LPXTG-motif cell wall-anchored protein